MPLKKQQEGEFNYLSLRDLTPNIPFLVTAMPSIISSTVRQLIDWHVTKKTNSLHNNFLRKV